MAKHVDGAAECTAGIDDPEALLKLLADEEECDENTMEGFAKNVKTAVEGLEVDEFVAALRAGYACVDVRSPSEYAHGHLPGASNLPLFTNDERANVGTKFKKIGRGKAMKLGMHYVRPKLASIVEDAKRAVATAASAENAPPNASNEILVHCWRGGMRSCAVAWLLSTEGGLRARTLRGGYKAFRAWAMGQYCYLGPLLKGSHEKKARDAFELPEKSEEEWNARYPTSPRIVVIGGRTGCGKTRVLHALRDAGHQVLDLEGLANHSGSNFGWVGRDPQPTTQQFGNDVAMKWGSFDHERPIFVEDEGPNVGKVSTPPGLYRRMRDASVVLRLNVAFQHRISVLVEDYASPEAQARTPRWRERMEKAVAQLRRRLGGERAAEAARLLADDDFQGFAEFMLRYYDKLYDKHIANAEGTGTGKGARAGDLYEVRLEDLEAFDAVTIADRVMETLKRVDAGTEPKATPTGAAAQQQAEEAKASVAPGAAAPADAAAAKS